MAEQGRWVEVGAFWEPKDGAKAIMQGYIEVRGKRLRCGLYQKTAKPGTKLAAKAPRHVLLAFSDEAWTDAPNRDEGREEVRREEKEMRPREYDRPEDDDDVPF